MTEQTAPAKPEGPPPGSLGSSDRGEYDYSRTGSELYPSAADSGNDALEAYEAWEEKSQRAENGMTNREAAALGRKWAPYAERLGTTVAAGADALMGTEYAFRNGSQEEKRKMLGGWVDDYQVQPEPVMAPEGAAMYDMDGNLTPAGQHMAQQQQQVQHYAGAVNAVQQFAEARTSDGQPMHPYFAAVYDDMTALARQDVQQGRQPQLADLYHRSVNARMAQAADVQRAKAASVSVAGSGGPAPGAGGRSDDIGDILDDLVPKGW